MVQIAGIIAGVLTSASMIPQFFKLIQKKDSKDISIGMLVALIAGVACWIWYGVRVKCTSALERIFNLIRTKHCFSEPFSWRED